MTGSRRVLAIDDSLQEAELLRRAVGSFDGRVELTVARGGNDVLELIDTVRPDLVVLDIKMPGASGTEVLASIRRHHGPSTLPVVVFSSSDQPAEVRGAYLMGASSFVLKPLGFEHFVETVAAILHYWLEANQTLDAAPGSDHG